MSRYYSKRNKQKNWLKTYGKPFIAKRAEKISSVTHLFMSICGFAKFNSSPFNDAYISALNGLVSDNNSTVIKGIRESLNFNEGFKSNKAKL